MSVPTSFTVVKASGGFLASWVNDPSLNASNVLAISLIYTTEEANSGFQVIDLTPVVNGAVITNHLLTTLQSGKVYQMQVSVASTVEALSGTSNVYEFAAISVPSQPVFNVTAGDQLLVFTLLNANQQKITLADVATAFDGFDSLTKCELYLSDKTAGEARSLVITNDQSNNLYSVGGFTIDPTQFAGLQNGHTYACAIAYFNELGKSQMSATKFFTPSLLPADMDSAAVETILLNPVGSGATVFWNSPSNALAGIQSVSKITSYAVWRSVVTAGVVGTPVKITGDIAVDVSGNSGVIQTVDMSGNMVLNVFDGVSYRYKYNDTSAAVGDRLRYYVTAKNEYGSSTVLDKSSYSDVITGLIPSAPVITSTPSDKQLKILVDTAGKLNGLASSGKVYVKVYAASQMGLVDASQNALHGYDWSQLSLDASSCITLANLNNGTRYGVSVKLETVSNVISSARYVSAAGHLVNASAPFKRPDVPTGLTISPLDASGNPLNGKLNLSWDAQTYLAANGFGVDASVNFVLNRHEGLDPSGNPINLVTRNPSPLTLNRLQDTGLVNDKVYHYTLQAYVLNTELNNNIFSLQSTPPVTAAPFASPASVTNLVVDCSGNKDLFATWTPIADPSATYQLVLSKDGVVIDTLNNVRSGTILPNSAYNFILGANYNVDVRSAISRMSQLFYSAPVSTIGIPFETPAPVGDLQISVESGQIFVTYEKQITMDPSGVVTGVKVNGYELKVFNQFGLQVGAPSTTSDLYLLKSDLSNNVTYSVSISAVGNAGNTGSGKSVTGLPANSSQFVVNPGPVAPILLTSEPSDKTIKLNWVHSDPTVNTFRIYQDYVLLNEPAPTVVSEGVYNSGGVQGNKFSAVISGLTNGRSYRFEVIAVKANLSSVQNAAVTNATPYKAPSAPLAASNPFEVDNNSLTVNWSVPADDGGAGSGLRYKVELFDTSNNTLADVSANLVTGYPQDGFNGTNLTDSARVFNNRTYFARVYAYYSINGTQPTSAPLRVPATGSIRVNPAPPNVTNLTGTAGDKSVVLRWIDPSANNAVYPYTTTSVQRFNNNVWTQIAALPRVGTFTDANLINGQVYQYRVIAQHSNMSAQQPGGENVNVTPGAAPIFEISQQWNNVTPPTRPAGGALDFTLRFNRNGAAITSAQLIGIDMSGVAHVVSNANLGSAAPLGATTFNGLPCLASETFNWVIPRINGTNPMKDLLIVLSNVHGSRVDSWPIPPNAFDA